MDRLYGFKRYLSKKIKVCLAQTNFSCSLILSIFFSALEKKPDKEKIYISVSVKKRNVAISVGMLAKQGEMRAIPMGPLDCRLYYGVTSKHFPLGSSYVRTRESIFILEWECLRHLWSSNFPLQSSFISLEISYNFSHIPDIIFSSFCIISLHLL